MWSSHASVLRKYVTFHLRDAGDPKQLLVCPAARGKRGVCVCQVTNQRLEEVVIMVLCPVWMEGFGSERFRKSAELWPGSDSMSFTWPSLRKCDESAWVILYVQLLKYSYITIFVSKVVPSLLPPKRFRLYFPICFFRSYKHKHFGNYSYLLSCRQL